jgi:hypothetical protein
MSVKSAHERRKRSLEKAFDGWQLGLVIVLVAWAMVMIVVPRPTSPLEIPAPRPSPMDLRALRAVEGAREARARVELAPAARALGGAVRAYGRAESAQDVSATSAARQAIAAAASSTTHLPPEAILELRALQTSSFVRAVRELEATGTAGRDVTELGGNLVRAFRDAAWADDVNGRLIVAMDDDELAVAYRKRWNALVALKPSVAATTLAEERILFAFAIQRAQSVSLAGPASATLTLGSRGILRKIDEYARVDPDYPADFARGVAHFGAGAFGKAHLAFANHLAARPDGPLTLRAQNFARAALIADAEGFAP